MQHRLVLHEFGSRVHMDGLSDFLSAGRNLRTVTTRLWHLMAIATLGFRFLAATALAASGSSQAKTHIRPSAQLLGAQHRQDRRNGSW